MGIEGDWTLRHWCPERSADVQSANLDDEIVLYHPERTSALVLNATAAVILDLCDGQRPLIEIIDLLRREYPEAAADMAREVTDSVRTFLEHGVLRAPRLGSSPAAYELDFAGAKVRLEADDPACVRLLEFVCGHLPVASTAIPAATFRLGPAMSTGTIAAYRDDILQFQAHSETLVATILLERVLDHLIESCSSGMLLHAAAVARDGRALVLAGGSGSGKTTLTTWLLQQGFDYLTEELVWIDPDTLSLHGFARPLHVKESGREVLAARVDIDGEATMKASSGFLVSPRRLGARAVSEARLAGLIFPTYQAGGRFDFCPLTKAQAASRLMNCLLNARQHLSHGFDDVARLVRDVPAFSMTYANVEQAGAQLETWLRG